jgi:AAA15 family ATPase/GTPase
MSITITVNTKPFDNTLKLYNCKNFIFQPGINSLVGCNGSGKTTLIDCFLIDYLEHHDIDYYKYNDRRSGGHSYMDKLLFDSNMSEFTQMYMASEGERIVCALDPVFGMLRSKFKQNEGKPYFVVFDAIDSGMSADEIIEIREIFLDTIIPDAKNNFNTELYVVIAANNYEWCADDRIHNIDITNAKELKFKDYSEYKDFILKSRKFKDKQRGLY